MSSFSISRPSPRVVTAPVVQAKVVVKDNIFASDFDEIFDSGKKKEGAEAPVEATPPPPPPPVYFNSSFGSSISRPSDKCPDMY